MIGSSFVGVPGIVLGRHNSLAWGITAAWVDGSDLWEEEINKDLTQYLVDGQ